MILKSKMKSEDLKTKAEKKNISEEVPNEYNAYRITERLAFPRLIGSEGELEAREIVVEEFKKAGYNPIQRDAFKTSFYNMILTRFIFVYLGIALILLALSFYISPLLTIVLFIIEVYLTFKALKFSVSSKLKLSRNESYNYETENIFTELKSKNSKLTVIFMGHWDSKSQTFPTSTRIMIFLISVFGALFLFLSYFILSLLKIILNLNLPLLNNILLDCCIIIAIIGVVNYFNKTGNDSPGAFDNAAAVGVLIELARFYKLNSVSNIDFIFLSTGSEELNLGGAIHFIHKFKDKFDRKSTFFINLDFIGGSELVRLTSSYGIPRKSSSTKLNRLFIDSAEQKKIKIKEIYSPTGVWSDYMPVIQEGFEACWIGSEPGLKYVHTKKDNMDLISKKGISNILNLCTDVVRKLETEYH